MSPYYFAIASLKSYLFDVFVWAIIASIVLIITLTVLKRTRLFVTIFGILLIVGAFPIAFMSELSVNGCCGASGSSRAGLGYLIGAAVGLLGIITLVYGKKLTKRPPLK